MSIDTRSNNLWYQIYILHGHVWFLWIYTSQIHWLVGGTGTPKDRHEVNRREVYECGGWVCDCETTGDPSRLRLIRTVVEYCGTCVFSHTTYIHLFLYRVNGFFLHTTPPTLLFVRKKDFIPPPLVFTRETLSDWSGETVYYESRKRERLR